MKAAVFNLVLILASSSNLHAGKDSNKEEGILNNEITRNICEKVAANDWSEIEYVDISAPKDAIIDINNDGTNDKLSCYRSTFVVNCSIYDGATENELGNFYKEQTTNLGEVSVPWDYEYEEPIRYKNRVFLLTNVGTWEEKRPRSIKIHQNKEFSTACTFEGEYKETIEWNKRYPNLKTAFGDDIIKGELPFYLPIKIQSFTKKTSIEPTRDYRYNLVKGYERVDYNNNGMFEAMAEKISVPSIESLCVNTYLAPVNETGTVELESSESLYEVRDKTGVCGNKTIYFYFTRYSEDQFFIKNDNVILTVLGNKVITVAERNRVFDIESIIYPVNASHAEH